MVNLVDFDHKSVDDIMSYEFEMRMTDPSVNI